MTKPYISVVIPVHNEKEVLETLYERLTKVMDDLGKPYEIILTNDGSTDGSDKILDDFYKRRPKEFRIIHFNSNYGQHMAIMAGFERVRGEIILTMDADLQNPPEEIPKLIAAIEEGHDVVNTHRLNRKDKKWRLLVSKLHNKLRRFIAPKLTMEDEGCMLRAYKRNIIDLISSSGEASTFITALAHVYAANPTEVGIKHEERKAGTSSYNFFKLIHYNFDLVANFSLLPLQIFTIIGLSVSFFSIIFVIYLFIRRLLIGPEAQGVFTLFAIAFFIMGLIIMGLGIMGEYVGRIYQETLKRPRFIIRDIKEQENN
jgi:undecaprenyl-phosphate 4-deoxy-4-formamido-L-arabinose transferase